MERSRRLDDDVLAEEIELYGDLVVAATAADGTLPQDAIDRILGVAADDDDDADADADADDGARGGPGDRGTHPVGGAPGTGGAAGSRA